MSEETQKKRRLAAMRREAIVSDITDDIMTANKDSLKKILGPEKYREYLKYERGRRYRRKRVLSLRNKIANASIDVSTLSNEVLESAGYDPVASLKAALEMRAKVESIVSLIKKLNAL